VTSVLALNPALRAAVRKCFEFCRKGAKEQRSWSIRQAQGKRSHRAPPWVDRFRSLPSSGSKRPCVLGETTQTSGLCHTPTPKRRHPAWVECVRHPAGDSCAARPLPRRSTRLPGIGAPRWLVTQSILPHSPDALFRNAVTDAVGADFHPHLFRAAKSWAWGEFRADQRSAIGEPRAERTSGARQIAESYPKGAGGGCVNNALGFGAWDV